MTSRPHLRTSSTQVVGVLALALFAIMAAVFLGADLGEPAGFPAEGSITASIGYALFALGGGAIDSESFLVAFEIVDVVLVAALAAAVMLARREYGPGRHPLADGGEATDGGDPTDGGEATDDFEAADGGEVAGDGSDVRPETEREGGERR